MKKLLFSFSGRIGRREYWFASIGLGVLAGIGAAMTGTKSGGSQAFGTILLISLAWPWLAVSVKRWHDRNKAGWWALLPLTSVIPVIGLIGPIWTFVEQGCLAGTVGSNRFGPVPQTTGGPLAKVVAQKLRTARAQTPASPPAIGSSPSKSPRPDARAKSPGTKPASAAKSRQPNPKPAPAPKPSPTKAKTGRKRPEAANQQQKQPESEAVVSGNSSPSASIGGIQQMIATAGPSLDVWPPQEFPGPVTVDRPIAIDFRDSTVWATKGPVLTIKGAGAAIRNACIEVTGDLTGCDDDAAAIAIQVLGRAKVLFENVKVCGAVRGVPGEDGLWHIPRSLALGRLTAGETHQFLLRLTVPTNCRLVADGQGVALTPDSLPAGEHDVVLRVAPGITGPYSARVSAITKSFKRCMALSAYFCEADQGQKAAKGEGQLIWPLEKKPADFHRDSSTVAAAQTERETPPVEDTAPDQDQQPGAAVLQPDGSHEEHPTAAQPVRHRRHMRSVTIPDWVRGVADGTEPSAPSETADGATQTSEPKQAAPTFLPDASQKTTGRPGKAFGL
jgi:uncharacterized membrane protein YhaH (DUF805 family)